jgi:predicted AlkP superfamily pyrophosphatase or phosphodiesterase
MKEGSFSLWARTTEVSVTLPSHTSMVTGVTPEKHGINWNRDVDDDVLKYPSYPTLFELAGKAGYTTALVSGKSKFIALNRPGTIDYPFLPPAKARWSDDEVAACASDLIKEHRPQVMMVHFPGADVAGHSKGWGTPEQLKAVHVVDEGVGQVIRALREQGLYDRTLIIFTADHGGAGRTHGANDPRSRHIPWIAVAPGVRRDYDLTLDRDLVINTEDTYATACWHLGIKPADGVDGKPIRQIMASYEPVQPATKPATKPARTSAASAGR